MTFLPRARRFDWDNFGVRVASGAILASGAVWAVWVFDWSPALWRAPFLIMIAVAGTLLSIEWAAMAAPRHAARAALVTTLAVATVTFLAYGGRYAEAWACVGLGALAAGVVARGGASRAIDAVYGVLYIAPACLVIVWLRETLQGRGWVLMLLATTWSADIAAFLVGSALKGPKLWPRFSPNKTWSGLIGGLAGATAASVGVAARFMHLSLAGAALIGLAGGLATMAGDLWESMLKRRFGVKDSGDLIPGHGGLLDRVDGLMFAVMAFAVARLVVRFGWAH
ncbi:MAG: phosphatidate cytidylyltransferase [Caulobacteraceae bacterium]|nr:phosphatidate cytidylyltransferase [Caulobacteraceae bacterium]